MRLAIKFVLVGFLFRFLISNFSTKQYIIIDEIKNIWNTNSDGIIFYDAFIRSISVLSLSQ